MANELKVRIEQVSREKNLDPEVVIRAIEDAILQAAKRFFNNDEDLRSRFNRETGDIDVFAVKEVVEKVTDEEIEISLEAPTLSCSSSASRPSTKALPL